ncbi:MAG: hypothetical protein WC087_04025 [Candidatus Paceibacterota bacterium]
MNDIEERFFEEDKTDEGLDEALKIELQKTTPWKLPSTFDIDYETEDGRIHFSDEGLAGDFPGQNSSVGYMDGF